jgi:hypothetical protein
MLTGRPPFDGGTAAASLVEIMGITPPAPSTVNEAVPAALDAVVAKALAKSLDQRYQNAADFAADLRGIGAVLEAAAAGAAPAHPVVLRPAATRPATARPTPAADPVRSNRLRWAIAAVLLLAALVLLLLWKRRPAEVAAVMVGCADAGGRLERGAVPVARLCHQIEG